MPDVRMPDGTLVRNVPDGVTGAQLESRLKGGGADEEQFKDALRKILTSRSVRGPAGPKGDRGPMGPTGERGPQGDVGQQGKRGSQGEMGPAGVAGPAGPQGEKGEAGAAGAPGKDGEDAPPIAAWEFDIYRNANGYISKVVARAR